MKLRCWLIGILTMAFSGCAAPRPEMDLSAFLEGRKAAVFVFLSPDCPVSQSYTFNLNILHDRFSRADVGFYGLVPGTGIQKDDIDRFKAEYKVAFPILPDPGFELADFWGALTTPEVFVVNRGGEVIYAGAIDNRYAALGRPRTVTTEHYLQDALNSFLLGREILNAKTVAVGCFIERERS